MAEVEVVVNETPEGEEDVEMREAARKAYLAGIGAAAMVQDWLESQFAKFVEKGEAVEREGRQFLSEKLEGQKRQVQKLAGRPLKASDEVQVDLEEGIGDFLGRMSVPTKSDIEALSAQVDELSKKLDALKKKA
jgi:poly(hydroxyalkanoate) granule-associated protein